MPHFKQHLATQAIDIQEVEFDFSTTDELLSHEVVRKFTKYESMGFVGFAKVYYIDNLYLLVALYKDGYEWWPIGYIDDELADVPRLIHKQHPKEGGLPEDTFRFKTTWKNSIPYIDMTFKTIEELTSIPYFKSYTERDNFVGFFAKGIDVWAVWDNGASYTIMGTTDKVMDFLPYFTTSMRNAGEMSK